jgi:hypothetical protein
MESHARVDVSLCRSNICVGATDKIAREAKVASERDPRVRCFRLSGTYHERRRRCPYCALDSGAAYLINPELLARI